MPPQSIDPVLTQEIFQILKDSSEFVISQAPEVVQQLLAYKAFSTIVGLGIESLVLVAFLFLARVCYHRASPPFGDSEWYIGTIAFTIAATLSVIGIAVDTCLLIKILCFPKAYLLGLITGI